MWVEPPPVQTNASVLGWMEEWATWVEPSPLQTDASVVGRIEEGAMRVGGDAVCAEGGSSR
jgi:hypothetical protein